MFVVDPRSPTPPYEQLRSQVIAQIGAGELVAGAPLPTVRRLAADLGLATNTVARTYRELEAEGYVATRGRRGTVVAGETPATIDARRAAEHFVQAMRGLGLSPGDTLRLVRVVLEAEP
ncbi:MAG: GntR family transcriptional regulator [Propionibacteriaceae bacterium]